MNKIGRLKIIISKIFGNFSNIKFLKFYKTVQSKRVMTATEFRIVFFNEFIEKIVYFIFCGTANNKDLRDTKRKFQ